MKKTITEIFIEVEETICVKHKTRENPSVEKNGEANPVIEICPHCHRAIFESSVTEIEGEKKL